MEEYENCGTIVPKVCNLNNHENSSSNELQYNGKQKLFSILKKISNDILTI